MTQRILVGSLDDGRFLFGSVPVVDQPITFSTLCRVAWPVALCDICRVVGVTHCSMRQMLYTVRYIKYYR